MKKLIIVFCVMLFSVTGFSQGILFPIKHLPKTQDVMVSNKVKVTSDSTYNTHFIRFDASVGGVQILYNKVTKEITFDSFLKVGLGATFALYKVTNGEAFNYLNFNGFLFFPITETQQTLSIAFTVSALHLFGTNLNPSVGINFEPANIKSDYFPVGPLINLIYNF